MVSAPGDMLVGPDEDQVSFVEATRFLIPKIDQFERKLQCSSGLEQGLRIDVAEAQQAHALRESVEERLAIFEIEAGDADTGTGAGDEPVHFVERCLCLLMPENGRIVVGTGKVFFANL